MQLLIKDESSSFRDVSPLGVETNYSVVALVLHLCLAAATMVWKFPLAFFEFAQTLLCLELFSMTVLSSAIVVPVDSAGQ